MQRNNQDNTHENQYSAQGSQGLSPCRTLVVDDDAFFRKILCKQLEKLGISEIRVAENGEQALQLITDESAATNLIFCDLRMPQMDGIAFLRHLADTGFDGQLVLMSGESERILTSVKKLADAHNISLLGSLSKPFKLPEIKRLLATRGTADVETLPLPAPLTREELENGLKRGAIEPFYQPQIAAQDARIAGAEALLRWRAEDGRLLPPVCVVPAAEQYGLVDRLTEVVFEQTIRQFRLWSKQGMDLSVSINLSMDNLKHPGLYEKLHSQVVAAGINPASVILELTESRLAVDMRGPLELMGRFKLMGYSLSIDDFGTGYSTMEQLSGFPFDELKIDRQFVNTALQDDASLSIIETSIALAKRLSMRVVAEGIETKDEWQLIREKGCDLAQGYFISRPLPAPEFEEWYRSWDGSLLA